MVIVVLYEHEDTYTAEIVFKAMQRSFGSAQVRAVAYSGLNGFSDAAVLINPVDSKISIVDGVLSRGGKVLIFGRIGPLLADRMGLRLRSDLILEEHLCVAEEDRFEPFNVSPGVIRYASDHPLAAAGIIDPRHLCRYDFTREWNNLGYGRIALDGPWGVSVPADSADRERIAWVEDADGAFITTYASVHNWADGSALWINRPVGPVDSLEWRIVEEFFGEYRAEDLSCFPYLSEIPLGYLAGVTMRLDCDQAVASGRRLFHLYQEQHLPISLALLTGMKWTEEDLALIRDVLSSGGAVLSHSASHYQDWGRSYDTALAEARNSRDCIEQTFPTVGKLRYTASPFHQNSSYAVTALADAGYRGFVSGTIRNDPEFLLGRAGCVPFVEQRVVSHSQQCMLHGDCYHRYGNSIDVYEQTFGQHVRGGALFGYLDHPFGDQYQYGWSSEEERLAVHEDFISHMRACEGVWWCSVKDCLDFLVKRDSAHLGVDEDGRVVLACSCTESPLPLAARWKGRTVAER